MSENVEVQFGANTSGLDNGISRVRAQLAGVGNAARGLGGVFGGLRGTLEGAFRGNIGMGSLESGLAGIGSAATQVAGAFGPVGIAIGATAAAAATATGILLAFGESMGDMAEKLDQTAQKLGMTTQQVSQWNAVAGMAGISNQALSGSMTRLERAMVAAQTGTGRAADAFKTMGINVKNLKDPNEVILQMADRFSTMANGPQKTALAMQLMGRAGAQMIPVLNEGRAGLEEQIKTAQEYGAVVDEAFVQKGLAVDDAIDNMNLGFQGIKNTLFDALAPAILQSAEGVGDFIKVMVQSYQTGGVVKDILDAVAVTFETLGTVGGAIFEVLGEAVSAFGEIFGAIMDGISSVFGAVTGDLTGGMSVWRIALNLVLTALKTVAVGFQNFAAIASGAVRGITAIWMGLVDILKAGFNLDFAGAYAAFNRLKTNLGNIALETGQRVVTNIKSGMSGIKDIWTKVPENKFGGRQAREEAPSGEDVTPVNSAAGKRAADAAKKAAQEALQAKLAALSYEQEKARENFDKIIELERQKAELIKAFYGANSNEYIEATRNVERAEKKKQEHLSQLEAEGIKHRQSLRQLDIDHKAEMDGIALSLERERLARMLEEGTINAVQYAEMKAALDAKELDQEAAHQEAMFQLKLATYRAERELADKTPEEKARIDREIERLEKEHQNRMAAIRGRQEAGKESGQAGVAKAQKEQLGKIADPIKGSFQKGFTDILTGAQGFRAGMIGIMDSLVNQWIGGIAAMAAEWITQHVIMKAISSVFAKTQLTNAAATGSANAASSAAATPIVGPALAPIAAAGVMALIMGFASMISAAGGADIGAGENPIAQLHAEEMVLPKSIANPLRAALKGPRTSGIAGDVMMTGESVRQSMVTTNNQNATPTFNYSPTISGGKDTGSLETMLQKEGSQMRRWISNQVRSGKLKVF